MFRATINYGEGVLLEQSQKEWEEYRNSEISFIDTAYGRLRGTFFDVHKIENHVGIVKKRALDLKDCYDLLMEEKAYY